jgi:hypothetical protein
MTRLILICFVTASCSLLDAKEENRLKDKLWKAVKEYVKETDTYKIIDFGRKELKKIKKKIDKKSNKIK